MICRVQLDAVLLACCLFAGPVLAQEADDAIAMIGAARTICADAPDGIACATAQLRSEAVIAKVIAEAGNTRDRGAFIDLVRAVLADPSPEVRTSALYALAKLKPDATDTPALLALMEDPVSNVRAGAWAAAWMSGDPAARLVARRVPVRPDSNGYGPDDASRDFIADAPGFALPEGAAYLRLTQDRRTQFQLEFLTPAPEAEVRAWAATLGAGPAVPLTDLLASDPATASLALGFLDAVIFGDPHALRLPPDGDRPLRLVLVYRDILFGQTGIAVIFGDKGTLIPPKPAEDVVPPEPDPVLPDPTLDDGAALDDAFLALSGFKRDAPAEESDLFASVLTAYGYGAEAYLELYPDGAYAAEAQAIVAGPRLVLDDVTYADTGTIRASFQNLLPGSSASLTLENPAEDYATEDSQYLPDGSMGDASFDLAGRLQPGVYLIRASVQPPDGGAVIVLRRDFSVTAGVAELATDKAEYAPGETISITFSGMSGDSQDYVATAAAGTPFGSYLNYVYLEGARDGVVTLTAPTDPGTYEVRAFFREDESTLRGSVVFTVTGTLVAPPAPEPLDPSDAARATLTLDKASYAPGEAISIVFAGMSGHSQDYISTAPAGASNATYLQYTYLDSALEGVATLAAPTAPGAYEVRAFFREDEAILRGSVPFTVTAE